MDGSLAGDNFHQFPADVSNLSTPSPSSRQQNHTDGVGTTAPPDGTADPSLAFTPDAAPFSHNIVSPGTPSAPTTTPGACHSSPDNGGEGDSPDVSDSNPGERYRCGEPNCKRGFPRKCELRKHQKNHSRPNKCPFSPECKYKGGAERKDLARHMRKHHPDAVRDEKEYWREETKCPSCAMTMRRDNLKRHRRLMRH